MSVDPIQNAVGQLALLPGIGERTALRLILHMLCKDPDLMPNLADALMQLKEKVAECALCHMITADGELCSICRNTSRNEELLCVVSQVQDLMALERTNEFRGYYHVLHGVLAPMDGVGPQELRTKTLFSRIESGEIKEVMLATPPTVEGEATALYLAQQLEKSNIIVSRIASGVPVGGELQFADRLSLSRAIALRRGF